MAISKSYIFRLLMAAICIMLLWSAFMPSVFAADADEGTKLDAVLVVDVSNSMNDSDRNKIGNEAMKMFTDMSSLQGDKIGVVAYTDQIVREKALLKMNSEQDKEELKSFIDQLTRGPYTDISVGLKEGLKVLQSGKEPGHSPLIVLMADGNNDFNPSSGRTSEQADKDLAAAVKTAKDNGIPIYTIGLNADGSLNKDALAKIASETNGKSFVTSTADTLPQILSEIFASHMKLKVIPMKNIVANGEFQEVVVTIPNANVLEANISVMSGKPVELQLIDPAGKQKAIPSEGVTLSKSKTYSLLKLAKPASGDWKLKVKGVSQDKIDINLIFNYDLQLVMAPLTAKTYKVGDTVKVQSYFEDNGQKQTGADLYKNMKATLLITDMDTLKTEQAQMSVAGAGFEGSFEIKDKHRYQIVVKAEDSSFFRETKPVEISAGGGAASTAQPPAAPEEPKEEGKPFPWLTVVLGSVGLLALIAAAILLMAYMRKKNKGFVGQVMIEIHDEDTGEKSNPQFKKLNAFKGSFRLHQLLQLAPELAETDKIVLLPGPHDSLVIQNKSGCLIEKAGRALDAAKGKELKKNDRIKISLQNVQKSIYMEYID
ncbi:vWA domain-containing protein [Paenibacillus contaminans]|nr:vWA domain-containing protein [Paenibacillus contaminans]